MESRHEQWEREREEGHKELRLDIIEKLEQRNRVLVEVITKALKTPTWEVCKYELKQALKEV